MVDDRLERIERLSQLHKGGHLTPEEFERLKAAALADGPLKSDATRSSRKLWAVLPGVVVLLLLVGVLSVAIEPGRPPPIPTGAPPQGQLSPMLANSQSIPDAPPGWRRIITSNGGSILRTDDSLHVKQGDTFLGWGCTDEGFGSFFLGRSWLGDEFGPMHEVSFRFDDETRPVTAPAAPFDPGLMMIEMTAPMVRRFQGAYYVHVFFETRDGATEMRTFDLTGSRRVSDRMAGECFR